MVTTKLLPNDYNFRLFGIDFQTFAAELMLIFSELVGSLVRKGKNAGYQPFFPSSAKFSK